MNQILGKILCEHQTTAKKKKTRPGYRFLHQVQAGSIDQSVFGLKKERKNNHHSYLQIF